jgi:hypothetical protein
MSSTDIDYTHDHVFLGSAHDDTVDLSALAETLKVIWVFETLADRKRAEIDAKARIFELTAIALKEANLDLPVSDRNVRFDSEQECQRTHLGDWKRLI